MEGLITHLAEAKAAEEVEVEETAGARARLRAEPVLKAIRCMQAICHA
jgi:hypothetical protein